MYKKYDASKGRFVPCKKASSRRRSLILDEAEEGSDSGSESGGSGDSDDSSFSGCDTQSYQGSVSSDFECDFRGIAQGLSERKRKRSSSASTSGVEDVRICESKTARSGDENIIHLLGVFRDLRERLDDLERGVTDLAAMVKETGAERDIVKELRELIEEKKENKLD